MPNSPQKFFGSESPSRSRRGRWMMGGIIVLSVGLNVGLILRARGGTSTSPSTSSPPIDSIPLSTSPSPGVDGPLRGRNRDAREHNPVPPLAAARTTDGIDLATADHFWRDWKLVTVRYRSDNVEQRFVYANEAAWTSLRDGSKSFPDGAMFGKVAFHVAPDPAFPGSEQPDSFTRLQVMKKNSGAYPETDGWGYAVMVASGDPSAPADDRKVAMSCHACHKLVGDRDFVFSKIAFRESASDGVRAHVDPDLKSRFTTMPASSLGATEQQVIAGFGKSPSAPVHYLSMDLFAGSVNESAPVVAKYATDDHAMYFLSDPKNGHFAIADGTPLQDEAAAGCAPGTSVSITTSRSQSGLSPDFVKRGKLCGNRILWRQVKGYDAAKSPGELPTK